MALGSNLITNGNFDTNISGWISAASPNDATLTWVQGELRAVRVGSGPAYVYSNPLTVTNGHRYVVSFRLRVIVGTVGIGHNIAIGLSATRGVGEHVVSITFTSTHTGSVRFALIAQSVGGEFFVDSVSYRELTMAITSRGFKLVVALIDSGRDQSNLTFDLVAATYADAVTATTAILPLLEAVTDAVVKGYNIIENWAEATLVLPSGTEVENRAVIVCQVNADPMKTATIVIPAASSGLFQTATGAGHNLIDVADADLLAYINIWQVSGALAKLSDGEYLDDTAVIISGKRAHRRSASG